MVDDSTPLPEEEHTHHGWVLTIDGVVRAEDVESVFLSGEQVIVRTHTGNEYVTDATSVEGVLDDLVKHKDERADVPHGPPPKKK